MRNLLILGAFAVAVVAIGGNRVRQNLRHFGPDVRVTVVDQKPAVDGEFTWSGFINPGNIIEIKGINGDISATYTDQAEVTVHAIKDGRRSDASDVRIQVVQEDGSVTICAVYPSRRHRNECAPGNRGRLSNQNNNTEVDFDVQVPRGVGFMAHTVNGDIDATGLTGSATAETVNGDVRLETTGYGRAETVNGDVMAEIGLVNAGVSFSTVNGDMVIGIPSGIDANVRGSTTSGDIESDFALAIRGQFGPKSFTGTLGDGGSRINLESVNGDIAIRRIDRR